MTEIGPSIQNAAIYARVSTEEQREGQTIDSQVAELERFCQQQGWPVVGIYKDEGWSGGVMERPELDRLRDDAQKAVFDAVLINDVDRLARDVAHLGVIKRDLERHGLRVIFRKLPSDTSPTSNLMVNILGSFAEFERELIADRTRRGRRHKIEVRKQYLGGNTSYGYRYLPKDRLLGTEGVLELVPAEASVVRRMFEWVDQEGCSGRQVLQRLNEQHVLTRNGTQRWAKSSVLRILRNEMYAGIWHYNKHQGCEPSKPVSGARYRRRKKCSLRKRPKGEWLPLILPDPLLIVPHERWERVQRRLDQNVSFSPRNEKHAYLLKGLIRCGGCSAAYVGDPSHGKYYYRCSERCKQVGSVLEGSLNRVVQQAVSRVILNPATITDPLRKLDLAGARETRQREQSGEQANRELGRLQIEEERVLDAYRSGVLSPGQLGQQLEKLKTARSALDVEISDAEARKQIPPVKQVEKAVTDYCAEAAANLDRFTNEQWREFLRAIIQRIEFFGEHVKIIGRIPLPTGVGGDFKLDLNR